MPAVENGGRLGKQGFYGKARSIVFQIKQVLFSGLAGNRFLEH